ncbi:DUF2061 domain-containing protein [Oxalicibacterium solurbis]|uniref:DUF2061 domain-containing protein n=1 Tax=Oxalicibacterium solurbis TaxID=69280 RepID=A0A8J3F545_9BURK|nr:DUF2061 domain-containing protein [Oxalicibacterium solurbis]GGI55127.1 hypothetical protein GCM10011430_23010 [Oxalicibacterium solurbis]
MVTAARTVSQVALHMSVAFAVMYAFTGSIALGGVAAVVEPICNVILLPVHDRLWERIRQRLESRADNSPDAVRNVQNA